MGEPWITIIHNIVPDRQATILVKISAIVGFQENQGYYSIRGTNFDLDVAKEVFDRVKEVMQFRKENT